MATLTIEQLDLNTPITQSEDGMDSMLATPYFEDLLDAILTDITAINDEISTGGVTDGANLGAGAEVFAQKNGSILEFRTLLEGNGISITQAADELTLGVDILDEGTTANAILTWDNVGMTWSELAEVLMSHSGGALTLQVEDSLGTPQIVMLADADADVVLYHDGVQTTRTALIASGGLEVFNTVTGSGWERVLTTSDSTGGGLPAPTVNNSILTGNLGGGNYTELPEVTISWAAGVTTLQGEDDLGTLRTLLRGDADAALEFYHDGALAGGTWDQGLICADANPGVRFYDATGITGTLLGQFQIFLNDFYFDNRINGGDLFWRASQLSAADTTVMHYDTSTGELKLYFDGTQVLETDSLGVRVQPETGTNPYLTANTGSADTGQIQFNNPTFGMLLYNLTVSQIVSILGEDAGSSLTTMAQFDPDGAVDLYFDGAQVTRTVAAASGGLEVNNTVTGTGFERVLTTSDGGGGSLTYYADDNPNTRGTLLFGATPALALASDSLGMKVFPTTGTNPYIFGNTGSADTGQIQFNNATFGMLLYNLTLSQIVSILGEDAGSTLTTMAQFDPDEGVTLYDDGGLAVGTFGTGLLVMNPASVNHQAVFFMDSYDRATPTNKIRGAMQVFTDNNFYITNFEEGADIYIRTRDVGGAASPSHLVGINGAETRLFFNNNLVFQTTAQGGQFTASGGGAGVVEISANAGQVTGINFEEGASTQYQTAYFPASAYAHVRLTDTGEDFRITNLADGDMARFNGGGSVELLDNASKVFETASNGWLINGSSSVGVFSGSGTPEGAVTAGVGSIFLRTDGGTGTSLYVKESGTGNTGWVAK